MRYKLGILDQSPIVEGVSAHNTLLKTVDLAQRAEQWGYERFWVSEHHNSELVASSSPEVLISYVLAKTNKIRIGSGGVMLQHYSPYKVAENFHLLATLAPERVDLGIGKAPGGLPLATKALQYNVVQKEGDFEERLFFLLQLIHDSLPENHEFASIQATPKPPVKPEVYLLGASIESAQLAAKRKISFTFARFINNDESILREAAKVYKEAYPSGIFIVSIAVVTASTEEEAKELASDQKITKVHLASGRTLTLQTKAQAEKFGEESGEAYTVKEYDANIIHGTPAQVKNILDELHETVGIDEFILHTPIQNPEQRLRSFELLSPNNLKKQTVLASAR